MEVDLGFFYGDFRNFLNELGFETKKNKVQVSQLDKSHSQIARAKKKLIAK